MSTFKKNSNRYFHATIIVYLALVLNLVGGVRCEAQINISHKEWQEDLRFLQNLVHQDYPFLFKKITVQEFDDKVELFYKDIPNMDEHEILVGFKRIVSSFAYGHTVMPLNGDRINFHRLPMNLYSFSNGIYVEGVQKSDQNIAGAKVLELEGVPIEDVLSAVKPVVPVENDQFYKAYGINSLLVPEILHAQGITRDLKVDLDIKFEKDGRVFNKIISSVQNAEIPSNYGFTNNSDDWQSMRSQESTPHYLRFLDKKYYKTFLPENKSVYVRYSSVTHDRGETIHDFYDRVFEFIDTTDVEKLILDVRLNGGGNNFNNKILITKIIESSKINKVGKFFVVIGRRTFSACQNLINELENYTNVIFVGEPSAENLNFYGDNRVETLPNSDLPLYLSWAWWQDMPEWQNAEWTEPHLPVTISSYDYQSNKDPILQRVLDFEQDDFILDPVNYLSELFISREIDLLASEARRLVADPDYAFVDFQEEFDKIGLMLLNSKQLDGAMFVFNMNTELFPDSTKSLYYLGETLFATGKSVDALGIFQAVVSKDATSEFGIKSKDRINEIKSGK
jgi:hypothetical protein